MNWLIYMGSWWRIIKTTDTDSYHLLSGIGLMTIKISRDLLRMIVRTYWGFKKTVLSSGISSTWLLS